MDRFFRDQLTDNLITDEFIDTTEKLVNLGLNIPKNNPGASDDSLIDLLVKNLELISTSVILSAASNLRGRHTILASIVKNKLTLRDEVLKAHNGGAGSAHTKEVLRGSSFFSADLFGALPESLTNNCVKYSQYLLKPIKTSSARGQGSYYRHAPSSLPSSAAPTSHVTAASPSVYNNFHNNNNNRNNNNYSNQSKTSTQQAFQNRSGYPWSKNKSSTHTPSVPQQTKKDGKYRGYVILRPGGP